MYYKKYEWKGNAFKRRSWSCKWKNKPIITEKAERVIAEVFDTEACMLVRGAGSGSIRMGLHAILHPGDSILVHKAPIYNTTKHH